jgi:hypothetical protein
MPYLSNSELMRLLIPSASGLRCAPAWQRLEVYASAARPMGQIIDHQGDNLTRGVIRFSIL